MFTCFYFFFFNDPATPEIYTLSLHDALPIFDAVVQVGRGERATEQVRQRGRALDDEDRVHRVSRPPGAARSRRRDRKSTRLNSSHGYISYAVFCLKKKKK